MPFGSYLLLKRLAVGGMAELFLAKDTRVDRMVVLKRILPYLAEEAEFVRMFLDEARIAAALHHPSIVELFELGHLEGSTFIAMEWVDGIDLRRIAQREQEKGGFMPPGIAAWITARLCEGLFHAHSARDASGKQLGIIHRDVSPQNVMLSFRGEVKLVDFGIAKATAWMGRSKPGVIKGKFLYLAPEQLTTEPLDHRTDLFALGTMLYELTTGQSPFYRTSTEAVIYAIRMEEPEPPATVRKGFPDALSRIILKCLTKDREVRYQTADEIRVALEDFIRLDAPTTKSDVQQYVSTLFGDDNERTSIYIPPNAKSANDVKNEQRAELARTEQPRTDPATAPARKAAKSDETKTDSGAVKGPFDNIDEERTMPLSSTNLPLVPDRKKIPEGRRETGEREIKAEPTDKDQLEIDDPPTGPTRNDRPKIRAAFAAAEAEKKNPWEPEVTAPLATRPPPPVRTASLVDRPVPKRDMVMTAEIDNGPRLVGDSEIGLTAVSTSGARDVQVGEVFAPLLPTMMGESAPELTRAAPKTPPQPPARSSRPQPKPPPPIASPADSIPELSVSSDVVSAGENTIGVLASTSDVERRVSEFDDNESSEPSPPAPSTRAPPRGLATNPKRSPTALVAKRPVPGAATGDPDDEVETVDQQNEFSVTRRTSSQKVMIAIFGGAAIVLVILLIVLLWPSSTPDPKSIEKPPKSPVTKKEDPPANPDNNPQQKEVPPPAPGEVQVQIRALKGTFITLDGKSIAPDATLNRKPGELVLKFICPSKKKNKPTMTLRATIPDSERLMIVEVPCP
ncbi:MAG: protein kinase [Archangium sp.]|nr:protein kinase [Archangium sp.]